ncbi:putative transporter [Glarea lozoyensis 74030]|uniref:Putative transporter n=1 Tax=Glarea lozoyensis (strain ATCC 74030 / MF5533) TaxID=1104152 RepID=H0EH11_GLAL7|nr:putative transporter [Glarea lozoyensis 74030]
MDRRPNGFYGVNESLFSSALAAMVFSTISAQPLTIGVEELVSLFDSYGVVDGYLSCVIAILYFATVYALEKLGNGVLAKPWARGLLADYAYPNVSCLTAQAKQYPLKKPGGFHWDFFLLGCTTFIAGILGIPLPNGLVPQ